MSKFLLSSKVGVVLVLIIRYSLIFSPIIFLLVMDNFLYPYVTTKVFIFRLLIEILVGLYLWLLLIRSDYKPSKPSMLYVLLIYFFIQVVTSLQGVNWYRSWWGNFERMDGLVTQLHYIAFFVLLLAFFKQKKDWLRFLWCASGVSTILFVIGFLQRFGVLIYTQEVVGRVVGSFGNSAYFAAYSIFQIFFGLLLWREYSHSQARWPKVVCIFYILLGVAALFLTETRGAIIGLLAGLTVLMVLWMFFHPSSRWRRYSWLPILGIVLLFLSFYFLRDYNFIKRFSPLARLVSISMEDATTSTRLRVWQIALNGWQERPLGGWGWGHFEVVFNKFYDPALYNAESWFDRAHNVPLDTLVTTGAIGLAAYLLIYGLMIKYLIFSFKKQIIDYRGLAIFCGLIVAYFIQNLFIFDMFGSYFIFYFLLAYLSFLRFSVGQEKIAIPQANSPARPFSRQLIYLCLAVVLIWLFASNIRPIQAAQQATEALRYSAVPAFYPNYQLHLLKALDFKTFGTQEIRYQLILERLQRLSEQNLDTAGQAHLKELLDLGISEFHESIRQEPQVLRSYIALGYIYIIYGKIDITKQGEWSTQALAVLQHGAKLSSTKQDLLFLQAEALVGLRRFPEALEVLHRARELDPSFSNVWINILKVATAAGNNNEVLKILQEADQIGLLFSITDLENLVNLAIKEENYSLTVELYKRLISLQPDSAKYYAKLAAINANIGADLEAEKNARRAMELDPSFVEEGKTFLEMLKQGRLRKK